MASIPMIAAGQAGVLQKLQGSRTVALTASMLLVALIAIADAVTGYDIRLAILYLLPIAWSTWRLGAVEGALVALAAMISWMVTFSSTHPYSHAAYFYLEGGVAGTTFLIIVVLLSRLQRALDRSDARFITVLEGLESAVHVADAAGGATLYENRRHRELFPRGRLAAEGSGEIYDAASRRWYLVRTRTLRWTDGREAVLRLLSDITDERAALELIARHREEAHRMSRVVALGELGSALAHELNQPLAAIATYNNTCLRLLESGQSDSPEVAEAMQKCRDQARRAGGIIHRLREVLRRPGAPSSQQDLNEVARTAVRLAEAEARAAGVALETELAATLPAVRVDRLLLEQVALNLVRNAIESVATVPKERRRVCISTENTNGSATFSVTDRGVGVPAELRERLFEAFSSTKPEGLGLGLSICRSVIEASGGSIRHEPGVPHGARFLFVLPGAAS